MRAHVIQDQYQVVTTSIRYRPDEGPCHTRLVQVVTTSIRSGTGLV